MDIKKLFIVTVFVVGLTPNNMRSDNEYNMPCPYAQLTDTDESDLNITSREEQEQEQLIEFVEQHPPQNRCTALPHYESHPSRVSFHTQSEPCDAYEDPYAPCDQESEKPYVIIYRVK